MVVIRRKYSLTAEFKLNKLIRSLESLIQNFAQTTSDEVRVKYEKLFVEQLRKFLVHVYLYPNNVFFDRNIELVVMDRGFHNMKVSLQVNRIVLPLFEVSGGILGGMGLQVIIRKVRMTIASLNQDLLRALVWDILTVLTGQGIPAIRTISTNAQVLTHRLITTKEKLFMLRVVAFLQELSFLQDVNNKSKVHIIAQDFVNDIKRYLFMTYGSHIMAKVDVRTDIRPVKHTYDEEYSTWLFYKFVGLNGRKVSVSWNIPENYDTPNVAVWVSDVVGLDKCLYFSGFNEIYNYNNREAMELAMALIDALVGFALPENSDVKN